MISSFRLVASDDLSLQKKKERKKKETTLQRTDCADERISEFGLFTSLCFLFCAGGWSYTTGNADSSFLWLFSPVESMRKTRHFSLVTHSADRSELNSDSRTKDPREDACNPGAKEVKRVTPTLGLQRPRGLYTVIPNCGHHSSPSHPMKLWKIQMFKKPQETFPTN